MRWLLVLLVACAHTPRADLVIEHGRVRTGSGWSDAVAVRDHRIVAFGADARAMPALRRFDAGGRLVIGGIHDRHVHAPVVFDAHDISGTEGDDAATTLAAIERATREVPRGTWLHGALNVDADLAQTALDRVAPEHPVWLDNSTGHVVVLNTVAERTLELSATPPRGGFIDKPGWRSEYARYEAMRKRAAHVTDEQIESAIRAFELDALAFGITTVTAFPLEVDAEHLVEVLHARGHKLRWFVVRTPVGDIESRPIAPRHQVDAVGTLLGNTPPAAADTKTDNGMQVERGTARHAPNAALAGTKYFIDGMQVERGAALREPYSDAAGGVDVRRDDRSTGATGGVDARRDDRSTGATGGVDARRDDRSTGATGGVDARRDDRSTGASHQGDARPDGLATRSSAVGRLDWSRADIRHILEVTRTTHDTLHLHVVGDRALDTVFDEMEALGATWPDVVLEHAHLVDVARAKRLGVRIVSNPFHSAMANINRARLGARVSRWMPLRDLVASHVPLALGSDGPLNPFYNIALATQHPTNPAQAIDRDTALGLYSAPLALGTSADLAVLTGDVDDPKTRSILTIVDGEIVFTQASATTSARTE